jgi:hypothetical protein
MSKTLQKKITKGSNFTAKPMSINDRNSKPYRVHYKKTSDLTSEEREQIYSIFDVNMRDFYLNSPWGLDESKKREEIFHETSRFFIIYSEDNQVIAYADIRYEANDPDKPEFPVLYVYEFQIAPSNQGIGLGVSLLNLLKDFGAKLEMKQLVLTCFKSNRYYYFNITNFFIVLLI